MEVIKIKNILTAIGNPELNNNLKKLNLYNIFDNDIQYQDGVIEILELKKDIDYLILNQSLPGNLKIEELIEIIQENNNKIKIIIILDKYDKKMEGILKQKNIYRIIYFDEINIDNIIKIISEDEKMEKYNEEIQKEIDELKKIIIKNNLINNKDEKINNNKNNNKKNNKIKEYVNKKIKKTNKEKNNKKIVSIHGISGSGKSTFTALLANELSKYYTNILIIDFDFINNSIHTIYGVKAKPVEQKINNNYYNTDISNLIQKINKKINLLSEINLIFNLNNKINYEKLKKLLNDLLCIYNLIIIDTSSTYFFDNNKEIMELSDECIFLTGINLLDISKSKIILNKYLKWNIDNKKIKIVFNKCKKIKINFSMLKNIYFEYKIIGFINYYPNFNFLINSNLKGYFIKQKNIKKIAKKII